MVLAVFFSHWSSGGGMTPTNLGSFSANHSYASPGNSFLSTSGHASLDRVRTQSFVSIIADKRNIAFFVLV